MFRLWAKCMKNNRLIRDTVISDGDFKKSRTDRVLNALSEVCRRFDLAEPIWLDSNIEEFRRSSRTRFLQDNFIEALDFDYMEIHVLEE